MRITNKMMSGNSLANINTNKEYLDKLNNQMATEKKITRPSDDPIVAIRALRLRSNLSEISQYYGANVPDAQAWVEVTQSAINSTKDMLSSLKSYADQGANGTNTASDRQKIYENMQAIQKQIYSNGNATNAGRSVFTGYRTGESLTFKEDTTADYRGIWDTFNASDVTKNTYVEGAPTLDEINTLGKVVSSATVRNDKLTVDGHTYDLTKNSAGGYKLLTVGSNTYSVIVTEEATATTPASYEVRVIDNEIEVKEDKVNRIRLSYDNINGSVRKGGTEGWDGKELDEEISGWGSTKTYDYYFNEDGTLTPDGKDWYGIISVNGKDVVVEFNEPYDQTFVVVSPEDKYTREDIRSDVGIRDTDDGIKITVDNTTYTITGGGTEAYSVDKGASVKADGSGNLTLTIPGPEGTQDIYTEIKIDAGGSITSAEKCKKIGEINYWLVKPEYSGESFISNASVSGTPDEIKVNVDDTTYTITRDETGAYSVNHGAAVEDDGSGNLKLKIETDDTYTEIGINGASPSLASVEKYNASVSGTPDEIKVKADDITYTITKNDEGAYIVDSANASVKDDGSGNLTLMIEMSDSYTEIKVDADGESPSLTGAEKYTRQSVAGVSWTPDEKIKVNVDGAAYTITKDASGDYNVDPGASLEDDGSGELTLTIPGPDDTYTKVKINVASQSFNATKYSRQSDASVSGTADEVKIRVGDITYTITKDASGDYIVDPADASVKDDGSGKLKLVIPGTDGSMDSHKEITFDVNGAIPSLIGAEDCTRISDRSDYAGGEDNGGIDLRGRAFGNVASENTTLVYRTELTGKASITPSSVTTDPVDGLQSFELKYGGTTYKIQKFKGEDRWFAVNSSGQALRNIEVVQNSDKSFKITEDTSPASSTTKTTSNVFNVSANGRAVTSYYCEHYLDVQITDSNSPVAVESGKELTAYQYLALGADDKNSDATAANKIYLLADTGELVFGSNVEETLSSLKDIPGVDTISVMYDKSSFEAGELRPEHYFDANQLDERHNIMSKIVYDSHNQDINYTVGTNQSIKINTNAEDVFDTQIIREIDDVLTAISEYNFEEEKVNKLKEMQEDESSYDETQREQIQKMLDAANKSLDIAKNKLQRTYEEAITQFGKFFDQANLADTACGTVDNRLTLVSNRLSEEKTTVTTLASENENVDITNIAVEVSEANLVYNAALMATGRISQQTLVDYI